MEQYDVIVIGAGVVGSAIARELSRYELKTAVLEKELDVATGNSSRNTGMLHGGFTYKLGTLRAQCSVEGNQEFDKVASELGVPFKRTGKLVVGFTEHDRQNILRFKANGEANGVKGMRMVDADEMHRIEPNAGGNLPCMFLVPESWILSSTPLDLLKMPAIMAFISTSDPVSRALSRLLRIHPTWLFLSSEILPYQGKKTCMR